MFERVLKASPALEVAAAPRARARFRISEAQTHVLFWIIAITVTGAVLVLRRPDAVTHAQFWAEDGVVWYADAYNLGGLPALLRPRDGYVQVLPRLVAAIALSVPMLRAPLVMDLLALVIQALPAMFLISPRMRNLGSLRLRCVLALLYLLIPDSSELHATITDSEFHLAVLAFLLFVAEAPRSRAGQFFDIATLVLSALTGPFCILLFPVALVLTVVPPLKEHYSTVTPRKVFAFGWRSHGRWRWVQLSVLTAGSLVQGITMLTSADARFVTLLGASPGRFARIVAGQIVLPIFLGPNRLYRMASDPAKVTAVACLLTASAALLFVYGLVRGSLGLRCFIFFSLSVLAVALMFPTYEPVHYQWDVFLLPGCGLRYWYLPKLALMATLTWLLGRQRSALPRVVAAVLVCLMALSIVRQVRYPARSDFQFATYARVFDQLPPGTPFQIPVLPGGIWVMKLVKR